MDAGPQQPQHQAMDVDAADAQALAKQLRALDAKELLAVALDALKRDAAPLAAALAARDQKRPKKEPIAGGLVLAAEDMVEPQVESLGHEYMPEAEVEREVVL